MAKVTSSISGTSTVYVITDQANNTLTITAGTPPAGLTFVSSGALLTDGQVLLSTLMQLLSTGLRPNVILNTNASFSN